MAGRPLDQGNATRSDERDCRSDAVGGCAGDESSEAGASE